MRRQGQLVLLEAGSYGRRAAYAGAGAYVLGLISENEHKNRNGVVA